MNVSQRLMSTLKLWCCRQGIAYPTAISVNSTLCHFSPLPSGEEASVKIAKGDLVKVVS